VPPLLALLAACAHPTWLGGPSPAFALLAIGDTGRPPKDGQAPATQLAVGRSLAFEDARAPVDALLLLGDNFYPNGLLASELDQRVRLNLIEPYGAFAARGAPILAVLGNHDYHAAESPELEAEAVTPLVPTFRLVGTPVDRLDFPAGVSIVFYDSTRFMRDDAATDRPRLTQALREARGPWRIAVAHHPLESRADTAAIEAAIVAAGVPVQLQLAGHLHDLRVSTPAPPLPALQIVSGAGGGAESRRRSLPGERFLAKRPGFARVDLVGRGADARLRVRLYAVSPDSETELVAEWSVGLDGVVREGTG
jgi:hypothetical protein